jgi:hypothetical protein
MFALVAGNSTGAKVINWIFLVIVVLIPSLIVLAIVGPAFKKSFWCFTRKTNQVQQQDMESGPIEREDRAYAPSSPMTEPLKPARAFIVEKGESAAGQRASSFSASTSSTPLRGSDEQIHVASVLFDVEFEDVDLTDSDHSARPSPAVTKLYACYIR